MGLTVVAFVSLILVVGALRLVEVGISYRHQSCLIRRGAQEVHDPGFIWMVLTHAGVLLGAALEVVILRRPFILSLAVFMFALFIGSNAVRWWVIHTLKTQWTVRVIDAVGLGVVANGPYRYVRHPNYVAVFTEMLALPLIHTAWLTAILGAALHAWVLRRRVALEDPVLMADAGYRKQMGRKPRFLPRLF